MIDILKLIGDEMLEAIGQSMTRGVGLKRAHGIAHKIIEGAKQFLGAASFHARIHRDEKVILAVRRVRGCDQHRLPLANRFETGLGIAAVVLFRMLIALGEFVA